MPKFLKEITENTKKNILSENNTVKNINKVTPNEYELLKQNNQRVNETIYAIDDVVPVSANTSIPLGGIFIWPGSLATLPDMYLPCDGRSISKSEYAKLFNILQYTYGGSGDSFYLPDFRNRTVAHLGTDSNFNTLGKKSGSTSHSHTLDNAYCEMYLGSTYLYANSKTSANISYSRNINVTSPGSGLANYGTPLGGSTDSSLNIQPSITQYYVIKVREDIYTEDLLNLDKEANKLILTYIVSSSITNFTLNVDMTRDGAVYDILIDMPASAASNNFDMYPNSNTNVFNFVRQYAASSKTTGGGISEIESGWIGDTTFGGNVMFTRRANACCFYKCTLSLLTSIAKIEYNGGCMVSGAMVAISGFGYSTISFANITSLTFTGITFPIGTVVRIYKK